MKFFPLLLILVFPFILHGQIILTSEDMPQSGDTIRQSHAASLSSMDYSSAGVDYEWDFTELSPLYQSVDTFVSVQETPWVYQFVFIWEANIAKEMLTFDQLSDFKVTDTYEFFHNSGTQFKSVGFGVTFNGIPIPNKYAAADVIYNFPLEYGDVDSSLSSYEFDITGIGYIGGWKKRVNYMDGWGILSTPYGSFDVVRVKSNIVQYDSMYVDSLGYGFPLLRNYTEYKWLGENFGLPLLTVTDDGLLTSIEYVDSVRNLNVTGINDLLQNNSKVQVFPNPVKDELNIRLNKTVTLGLKVKMYDMTGRLCFEMNYPDLNGNAVTINLDGNLHKGMYVMMLEFDKEVVTHKVVVE